MQTLRLHFLLLASLPTSVSSEARSDPPNQNVSRMAAVTAEGRHSASPASASNSEPDEETKAAAAETLPIELGL